MVEIIAMGATLDLFSDVGIDSIFAEACRLGDRLQRGLKDLKYNTISSGPIVNFAPFDANALEGIMKKLKNGKVSFAKRGPGIRLSAHAYNSDRDIDRVLSLLK